MLIGGTITLGSFYLASVLTGAGLANACDAKAPEELREMDFELTICGDANVELAYIPVLGPFIAMGELQETEISVRPLDVALVAVGIGQITGLALLIAGGIVESNAPDTAPAITVQPAVGPTGAALTLHATF